MTRNGVGEQRPRETLKPRCIKSSSGKRASYVMDNRVELESSRVGVAGNVGEQARTRIHMHTHTQNTHPSARTLRSKPYLFFCEPAAVAGGGRRVGPDGGIGMGK